MTPEGNTEAAFECATTAPRTAPGQFGDSVRDAEHLPCKFRRLCGELKAVQRGLRLVSEHLDRSSHLRSYFRLSKSLSLRSGGLADLRTEEPR
jgi:hypothetical protein